MVRCSFFFVLCSVLYLGVKTATGILLNDPDIYRNVSELISSKGYYLEEHTVLTDDGYLLSAIRIPYGRRKNFKIRRDRAVLMIHGILGDSSNWVLNYPDQSLGFILPDAGYDTWLINTRGTTYSKRHVLYTPNQFQFWNFSFDQKAQYDVSATIDYILGVTGMNDLYVIGHSEGTTEMFALLSEFPAYNNKVKLFIALAPVAKVAYTTTLPRILVPFAEKVYYTLSIIGHGELVPYIDNIRLVRAVVCQVLAPALCEGLTFASVGYNAKSLNQTRLGVYFANFPSTTSTKSAYHYAQLVRSNRFRKFDYGVYNRIYYNQDEPPDYDISRITTPTALFWTVNDKLADPIDVAFIRRNLKSLVLDYQVPLAYDHIDFFLAINAYELIHKPILQLLTQY